MGPVGYGLSLLLRLVLRCNSTLIDCVRYVGVIDSGFVKSEVESGCYDRVIVDFDG